MVTGPSQFPWVLEKVGLKTTVKVAETYVSDKPFKQYNATFDKNYKGEVIYLQYVIDAIGIVNTLFLN